MEGVLAVDKSAGMTSHDVVNRVRRLARLRRVGHAGTLDPLATGVLLLCLGRTTRLIEYLVGLPKVYETKIRLGQTTDSYDADGELVAERPVLADLATIEYTLTHFSGQIWQRPPMFSAIKRNGQPLYKLARQGIEVERPLRSVTIYELALLAWEAPYLTLRVKCSAGTYIRSLAHDLGEQLGCGGHVAALRRTAVGAFTVQDAHALEELDADKLPLVLQPSEQTVYHLPALVLPTTEAQRLCNGLQIARLPEQPTGFVRIYDEASRFLGIAEANQAHWRAKKIFHPA